MIRIEGGVVLLGRYVRSVGNVGVRISFCVREMNDTNRRRDFKYEAGFRKTL